MNQYRFEEMRVGMSQRFEVRIGAECQETFLKLTGDCNMLHCDEEFARERGFDGRVVYGMLAASYYSTLVGVYLPGENCLLNDCKVTYCHPVYIGDVLTVEGTVSDVRKSTRRVKITGKMTNHNGVMVNTAVITVSFTSGNPPG